MEKVIIIIRRLICCLIYCYRCIVSPCFPPRCRFHPTCSQYAIDAVNEHGVSRGLWLALKRFLRCHPGSKGGYDPVNNKENT